MGPDAPSPRVAIMQPYFLPAPGYFQLLHAADIFVFFDDAQFVTKRWTHRNRLVLDGEEYRFTVPLEGRSQNRRIDELRVHPAEFSRWRRKFLATLRHAYGPGERLNELAAMLEGTDIALADLAIASVRWAMGHIGLSPRFERSSRLDYDREAGRVGKLLSLCEGLGAQTYVNALGGRALYSPGDFEPRGIDLRFVTPRPMPEEFAKVSILHPLLSAPPATAHALAADYTLQEGDAHGRR